MYKDVWILNDFYEYKLNYANMSSLMNEWMNEWMNKFYEYKLNYANECFFCQEFSNMKVRNTIKLDLICKIDDLISE